MSLRELMTPEAMVTTWHLAHVLVHWEEKNCLLPAGESTGLGQRPGEPSWGPVALTAVSFSRALKRSSQATADFWKASCRLMRLSTSSTVQPSSALRTNGSWLHSQASAIPASLPNTSTSKTAGVGGLQRDGRSEWAPAGHCNHSISRTGTEKASAPEQEHRAEPGSAKSGYPEFHAQDSWSYLFWELQGVRPPPAPPPRAWCPQPVSWSPKWLTKLEPVHPLLPLVSCLLAPCLQLRQLL